MGSDQYPKKNRFENTKCKWFDLAQYSSRFPCSHIEIIATRVSSEKVGIKRQAREARYVR
jgi:hypothetical protein